MDQIRIPKGLVLARGEDTEHSRAITGNRIKGVPLSPAFLSAIPKEPKLFST